MNNTTNTLRSFKIGVLTFMLFCSNAIFAATVNVSTNAELEKAVSSASTATEIVLTAGTYSGGSINLDGNTAPVVIHPSSDFSAHISSHIIIRGNNITIQKCELDEITIYGDDVKILRNIWDNAYAPATGDWLNMEETAYRTEIAYNEFKNRPASWSTVGNDEIISQNVNDNTPIPYETHVHHNYFKNIVRSDKYSEVYLIYTNGGINPAQSLYNNIIIEYNLFDNSPGDGRMLDIKTNGVIVRNNTVINLKDNSSFKNRQGNRVTFENNVFIGGHGQISAQGDGNIIRGNYIEYNQDNQADSAFRFYYGSAEITGAQYNQMHDTLIENNTLVNAYYGFEFGRTSSTHKLPMVNTIIRGNKIINGGGRSTTNGDIDFQGVTWENNKYSGNGGEFASKMTQDTSLTAVIPPHLSISDVGPYATSTTTSTTTVEPEINTGAFTIAPGVLK